MQVQEGWRLEEAGGKWKVSARRIICRENTYYLSLSTAKLEKVRELSVSSNRTFHRPSECDTPKVSQGGQHNIQELPGRDTACDLSGQTWDRFESHIFRY